MEALPLEMQEQVLIAMRIVDLFQLQLVCKSWKYLVDHIFFNVFHVKKPSKMMLIKFSIEKSRSPPETVLQDYFCDPALTFEDLKFALFDTHIQWTPKRNDVNEYVAHNLDIKSHVPMTFLSPFMKIHNILQPRTKIHFSRKLFDRDVPRIVDDSDLFAINNKLETYRKRIMIFYDVGNDRHYIFVRHSYQQDQSLVPSVLHHKLVTHTHNSYIQYLNK